MEESVSPICSVRVPWTAYPRAHYFRKHFNDVHDRLRRILGALPVPIIDDACIIALEKVRKRLGSFLEVDFLGRHTPPPGEVYVVDPVELRNHVNTTVPGHRTELSHEPPLKINVFYAQIHDMNGSLQQMLFHDYDTSKKKTTVHSVQMENLTAHTAQLHIADDVEVASGGSAEQPEKCVEEDQRQENATNDKDVEGLVDDYEGTMSSVEYILNLLRKLTFEIEGYLLQGGGSKQQSYIPPPSTIPHEMRKSLLAVNDVYAVCTLYNEPTVLLKARADVEVNEFTNHSHSRKLLENACFKDTINTIQSIRLKYKYTAALNVEVVSRPFQHFARNDVEQGDTISASENYVGTLGGFVQWLGDLYMLTCQHVVGSKSIVKVQKPGCVPTRVIGRATPNMSIESGTHGDRSCAYGWNRL
ncbi:hypothetical protein MAR_017069 [Mya arenaria]|uniref:Uncharacterized protein n=1 Tax=Mya arenaria TaxID=6604 RepID=A0ABY7EEE6_MYAAR|nr:hypothetical protein MAR_017069 [Mya arenaria]